MKYPNDFKKACTEHRWSRHTHGSCGPQGERTIYECLDCLAVKVVLRHMGDIEAEATETTIVEPQRGAEQASDNNLEHAKAAYAAYSRFPGVKISWDDFKKRFDSFHEILL